MRITDVEPISLIVERSKEAVERPGSPVSMPYAEEVKEVVFGRYQTTIVKVHTDEGITGIGEAGPQQLQRDAFLVQPVGAAGEPDLAHAASAQHALDSIRP